MAFTAKVAGGGAVTQLSMLSICLLSCQWHRCKGHENGSWTQYQFNRLTFVFVWNNVGTLALSPVILSVGSGAGLSLCYSVTLHTLKQGVTDIQMTKEI